MASNITNESATTKVPIFAPQSTERYAIENPKNIIPTSLTSASGLYSTNVDTRLTEKSTKAIFCVSNNISILSGVNSV